MKFLVDECVGPAVAQWLKVNKIDTISVYDLKSGMTDEEVVQQAALEQRIIITNDKDFGEMVFKQHVAHYGVILLRLNDERPANKILVLHNLLIQHTHHLQHNFIVVSEQNIRIIKPQETA